MKVTYMCFLVSLSLLCGCASQPKQYPITLAPGAEVTVNRPEYRMTDSLSRNEALYEKARDDADRRTWITVFGQIAAVVVMVILI